MFIIIILRQFLSIFQFFKPASPPHLLPTTLPPLLPGVATHGIEKTALLGHSVAFWKLPSFLFLRVDVFESNLTSDSVLSVTILNWFVELSLKEFRSDSNATSWAPESPTLLARPRSENCSPGTTRYCLCYYIIFLLSLDEFNLCDYLSSLWSYFIDATLFVADPKTPP